MEKLECSLSRTRRLTRRVQGEIDDLKQVSFLLIFYYFLFNLKDNLALRQNSCKIHRDLESTLDDAKKTQKELEKIEKIFRSTVSTKSYRP